MIKDINRYVSILFPAALVYGCFFLSGCENDPEEVKNWTEKVVLKETGRDIESYLSQGGIMKAKLTSPQMVRSQSDTIYTEFPNTLYAEFYNDKMEVESWLTALYGKYFENLNKVYLRDSVTVINVDGDTLRCPDLWWDQNAKLFYTDKYATYKGVGKNIYGGKGLEATQDLDRITFKEPTGTMQVSESGFPE